MTARERAYETLTWANLSDPGTPARDMQALTSHEASNAIRLLESAGLTIVDRELHRALVEAVRARVAWEDGSNESRYRGSRVAMNESFDRAVQLLAEKGEG